MSFFCQAQRDLRKVPRVCGCAHEFDAQDYGDPNLLLFQIWNSFFFHSVLHILQRKASDSTREMAILCRATLQQPAHEAGVNLVRRSSPL